MCVHKTKWKYDASGTQKRKKNILEGERESI